MSFIWLEKTASLHVWITQCLLICLSGYLLLTAPIDDFMYGHFRGIPLLLTELLPYFLWLYVFVLIKPETRIGQIPWLVKGLALCAFLWFVYFFAVMEGRGSFHQINHVLGIVFYCHIGLMAIYNLQDDLVAKRRKTRIAMAVFLGTYSSFLAVLEIVDYSMRADIWFSVINSGSIFMLIFGFSILAEKANFSSSIEPSKSSNSAIPITFVSDLENMKQLMAQQFYTRPNLTIGLLAEALNMPEHRLRTLINKHLGYQNFSAFLNSYRIPAAIDKLKNPECATLQILTLALDLGYGSIGPFNRAFKQTTGFTPSEYRKKFQNRP